MPRSVLSLARVRALLPETATPETIEARLFASKAEVEGRQDDRLDLSVTPDRLDLLSEGGLALHLAGVLGSARGLPKLKLRTSRPGGLSFRRDRSVEPIRPHLAGLLVRAPAGAPLDDGMLEEAVRFQELLHATIGRDRRAMSLGIYPARKLRGPVTYRLEPAGPIRFAPLHGTEELAAERFFATDPMAAKYGALGTSDGRCLTLRDADGRILSLPPVLNSATAGEAKAGDRALLLEATGTRERAVREGLGLLLVVFAARGWSVEPVPVSDDTTLVDDGRGPVRPPPVDVPAALVRPVVGEAWTKEELAERAAVARLGLRKAPGGWRVSRPPWRPDLLAAVDVVEELLFARELRPESGVVPPSPTRGRHRAETRFRRRIARLLLGLGYLEPHTPILVSEEVVHRLGGPPPLPLENPVSSELAYLRDRLLLSHLGVLARNRRHGYPQRFAEVGPVVVRAPDAETGGATRYHASLVLAGEGAGFASAASAVDYLLRACDIGSVREPCELPGTIPGRSARVRVAGEAVAEFGELLPELLDGLGVPVPVAWAELDLSALWPLSGGHDTD